MMSDGAPRISVVLPVRDGGKWLHRALSCLVRQSVDDLEIVVVDDGSTDDTPDRLTRWARRDARIRVITQAARGLVPTLDAGLRRGPGTGIPVLAAVGSLGARERIRRALRERGFQEEKDFLVVA